MFSRMTFTAVGDFLVQKRLPCRYDGFQEIAEYIGKGEMRFFNLETTIHNYEAYASRFSGGSWLCAPPAVLEDAKLFGFNILTFANNHTLDFACKGLVKTLEYVKKAGFPSAGAGLNMEEASAPAYLDLPSGRVALIAVVSTFDPSAMAGEQSRSFPGRPGVNGLRYSTVFRVTPEQMNTLKKITGITAINAYNDLLRSEGYLPPVPEGKFEFGEIIFEESEIPGKHTCVNETDMARVERAIYEAQLQADYIVISVHSHEIRHTLKSEPGEFLEQFARRCIDSGAHAVVGHGPHCLRPIEIYKNRPIFYSLGDFVLHNENIQKAPADFFEKYNLPSDATMHELFKVRSNNFTRGLQVKQDMWETVIPYWEMEDGNLKKLSLLAVELGFGLPRSRSGWPAPAKDSKILMRLAGMSAPYGTEMRIEGNRAEIMVK